MKDPHLELLLVPGCKSKLLSQEGAWRLKKMQYDSFANNYNPKTVDCWVLVIKPLEAIFLGFNFYEKEKEGNEIENECGT